MIESILENRRGIIDYIENNNNNVPDSIKKGFNADDIAMLLEIPKLLIHFERYSKLLSSETKPTISYIIPSIYMLVKKLAITSLKNIKMHKATNKTSR